MRERKILLTDAGPAYRAVHISSEEQIERQRRQQVHHEPALQVVGGDVARIRHHLALFVHICGTKVQYNICKIPKSNRLVADMVQGEIGTQLFVNDPVG